MRHPLVRAALALLTVGGLLLGLLRLGQWARTHLERRDHYAVAFAAIQCPTPPGLTPAEFLAEVQYLGSLPDQIHVLEPHLAARLAAAFALHPWVERVEGVALRGGAPAERVAGPSVRLQLRTPALVAAGRVVDAHGVLLPASAPADGLIALRGPVPPPAGPAGTPWGDAGVEGTARTAAYLQPLQGTLRLATADLTAEGLVFGTADGTIVLWGRPVGAEPRGEPAAEAKRARLQALADRPDRPRVIDVRGAE